MKCFLCDREMGQQPLQVVQGRSYCKGCAPVAIKTFETKHCPPMRNASYVGPLVAWSFAMLVVGFWIGFEVFSG